MTGVLAAGVNDRPWFIALVLGQVAALFMVDHLVARRTGRRVRHLGYGYLYGAPWYWRATSLAFIGCMTAYGVATGRRWAWLLSLAAWGGFVWTVVTRKADEGDDAAGLPRQPEARSGLRFSVTRTPRTGGAQRPGLHASFRFSATRGQDTLEQSPEERQLDDP